MIVIIIIGLLVSIGSYPGLFGSRDRIQLEEVSIEMLGLIDEVKLDDLLGRTDAGAIVRKRSLKIEGSSSEITFSTGVNKASEAESSGANPAPKKTWSMTGLELKVYQCPGLSASLNTATEISPTPLSLTLNFSGGAITPEAPASAGHLILHIIRGSNSREIHIDTRTGLTYERPGNGISAPSCI